MYSDFTSLHIQDIDEFKMKLLRWADQFEVFTFLDSNGHRDAYSKFDFIIGVDVLDFNNFSTKNAEFEQWKGKDFVFGHFSYEFHHTALGIDIKPETYHDYPLSYFFKPRYIVFLKENRVYFNRNYPETYEWLEQINSKVYSENTVFEKPHFELNVSKEIYLQQIHEIQQHIKEGTFYELNYCVEFTSHGTEMNPVEVFNALNNKAVSPMSALYKYRQNYTLCVSPERFLAKRGAMLISQPIKGTARRDLLNLDNDCNIKQQLETNIKDLAENKMIVDLVRNDMTHHAETGTIQVTELCKVYSYPFVHQMISTIQAKLKDEKEMSQAISRCIPAGSMTGAPKLEVMKCIHQIESFRRGLYSGNIGYMDPEGDFDFNVVIRSMFFHASSHSISIKVGGAITLLSDAEEEYNECLTKAEGLLKIFDN